MSTQIAGESAATEAAAPPEPAPEARGAPVDGDDAAALGDADPTFCDKDSPKLVFESGAFARLESAYFRMAGATGEEPVLVCMMGPQEVTLPLDSLPEQFGIAEDSADMQMLKNVAAALKYVSLLRIGDALPSEIISGEASWEVPERSQAMAYKRVTIQLADALFGNEKVITDPALLEQLAEDPQVRKRISEAITEAAKRLELGEEGRETVIEMIEDLAQELAYVETLREQVGSVFMIRKKIEEAIKMHSRDVGMVDIARSVLRLLVRPEREFAMILDQADGQTGEIMAVLKNLTAQIRFIRMIRDELHCRLLAFSEVIAAWNDVDLDSSYRLASLLRDTQRFLAPRYMSADTWELVSRRDGDAVEQASVSSASSEVMW